MFGTHCSVLVCDFVRIPYWGASTVVRYLPQFRVRLLESEQLPGERNQWLIKCLLAKDPKVCLQHGSFFFLLFSLFLYFFFSLPTIAFLTLEPCRELGIGNFTFPRSQIREKKQIFLNLDLSTKRKNPAAINWEYVNHVGLYQSKRAFTGSIWPLIWGSVFKNTTNQTCNICKNCRQTQIC